MKKVFDVGFIFFTAMVDVKMKSTTTVTGTGFKWHSSLSARRYLSPEIGSRQTFRFETFSNEDDLLCALKPVDGF